MNYENDVFLDSVWAIKYENRLRKRIKKNYFKKFAWRLINSGKSREAYAERLMELSNYFEKYELIPGLLSRRPRLIEKHIIFLRLILENENPENLFIVKRVERTLTNVARNTFSIRMRYKKTA